MGHSVNRLKLPNQVFTLDVSGSSCQVPWDVADPVVLPEGRVEPRLPWYRVAMLLKKGPDHVVFRGRNWCVYLLVLEAS